MLGQRARKGCGGGKEPLFEQFQYKLAGSALGRVGSMTLAQAGLVAQFAVGGAFVFAMLDFDGFQETCVETGLAEIIKW